MPSVTPVQPISVILLAPWKGGDVFLVERAWQSLAAQTLAPHQIIVVKYGENEMAEAVYARLFQARAHSGPCPVDSLTLPDLEREAVALQMGLAWVTRDTGLVCVIDPEYAWRPTYLAEVWNAWENSAGQVGMIYTDETSEDFFGLPVDWTPRRLPFDRHRLFGSGWMHLSAMALNYQRLIAGGGFDNLSNGAPDWDVALRLSQYGVRYLAEPLVHHYWWQTEDTEAQVWQYFSRHISARIKAKIYGEAAPLQLSNWQAETSPAMQLGEAFTHRWLGDKKKEVSVMNHCR